MRSCSFILADLMVALGRDPYHAACTEDIGTDHESVSYYDSYDEACRYCRGLYNTLYMIQEVQKCDSPKELSF